MTPTTYRWAPPLVPSPPVQGRSERLPIRRLSFMGRNHHAHAVEMGGPVDKSVEVPFHFTKALSTRVESGATVACPPGTNNDPDEMALVRAIGAPGFRVAQGDAAKVIHGYACGLDMTRRDLQLNVRDKGRPWDLGKEVDESSIASAIVPMPGVMLERGALALRVNGLVKQQSDLSQLIWNLPELIADLSQYHHLQPGDLICTGRPEGVGPLQAGDRVEGSVEGVRAIALQVGPAE